MPNAYAFELQKNDDEFCAYTVRVCNLECANFALNLLCCPWFYVGLLGDCAWQASLTH